ncbi:hypothetical protein HNY73_004584 [Argiope bruennichi]|uniref:Uncharacterized protein n=1 Tax=Argiope bruennichi TaxID=94029 RepID=A0A8T0FRY6_ARGBR|nr:hypothetical protein HNY73_004584 [Argiope bruennichi]
MTSPRHLTFLNIPAFPSFLILPHPSTNLSSFWKEKENGKSIRQGRLGKNGEGGRSRRDGGDMPRDLSKYTLDVLTICGPLSRNNIHRLFRRKFENVLAGTILRNMPRGGGRSPEDRASCIFYIILGISFLLFYWLTTG